MFLRNAWYAAIWAGDLAERPVARTIIGQKLVLFRGASGGAAALADRCCHRAAPLSRGEVVGDTLRCGYHGLSFDAAGRCVAVPIQEQVPRGAAVQSFPTVERQNVVWVWMGDAARADPAKIPDLPWLASPDWTTTPGYLHVDANAQLLVDNLLDFTHVPYVHPGTLAGDPREAVVPIKTERLNHGIRVGRWLIDVTPPPLFAAAGGFTGKVDRWQWATWLPPSIVFIDVGCAVTGTGAPEGDRSQGFSIWSSHLIAPESETSCHYSFAFARNFKRDDAEMSRLLFEGSRDTFLQDKGMLEAQQTNLAGAALDGLVDVVTDAGQLQVRRVMEALIRAEQPYSDTGRF
ncbi:MAG TPA: aromatic ring-hydroxylating dioxygenase subunit alpha [Stellaceae bacterium]|nr:aromatic ring-hydroxylating dioxygenase subunit alpha [Stellaceae bacterium]